jgi:uncharacterized Ntn-hydrolase superfamily protein
VDRHNADRIDQAVAHLVAGGAAQSVVSAATLDDPQLESRQYGVVTFDTESANFTGSETLDWSGAATDQSVSVQGNILAGPEVVRGALEAFTGVMSEPGALLSDALITGLEAGAAQGGDKRCPEEQTALSAFIAVAHPSDESDIPSLWLTVPPQVIGRQNPVTLLRQVYDEGQLSPAETPMVDGNGPHVAWWGLTALALPLAWLAFWINRRVGR